MRTPAQTETALFWSENTAIQWPRTLRQLAVDQGLDLVESARLLALTQVGGADAILSCFDAKYHYYFWRPIHAIQRADTAENPATIADTSWVPLLNVNHPEYPSAHACYTTAVTRGLAGFFGDDDVAFSMLSTVTATTHEFNEFSNAAREVCDARIWAGLHFRNSTAVGGQIGRKVARYIRANFLTPV